jgi:hypothetical protein
MVNVSLGFIASEADFSGVAVRGYVTLEHRDRNFESH